MNWIPKVSGRVPVYITIVALPAVRQMYRRAAPKEGAQLGAKLSIAAYGFHYIP